jgi:hypothetical protein
MEGKNSKVRKEEEKKVERKNKYIPAKLSVLVSHVRPLNFVLSGWEMVIF